MNENLKIKEIIVVEGRDDTAAISRAIDAQTIETHGYGIRRETWKLIDRAYSDPNLGIIIFTDPDHAGNEIRRRVKVRCPNAKEAFLARADATKDGDIGIENAEPEAIIEALSKAHCTVEAESGGSTTSTGVFTKTDLQEAGLMGAADSAARREALGKALGIGYGNSGAFLKKLNHFGISREAFNEALLSIDNP